MDNIVFTELVTAPGVQACYSIQFIVVRVVRQNNQVPRGSVDFPPLESIQGQVRRSSEHPGLVGDVPASGRTIRITQSFKSHSI